MAARGVIDERLYLITDRRVAGGAAALLAKVARALAGAPRGRVLVQLRDKDLDDAVRVRLGRDLRRICHTAGARLLINGSLAVARTIEADGVHVPDGPDDAALDADAVRAALGEAALVGASLHLPLRARTGADLVTLGPVWPTASKPGAPGIGTAPLHDAAREACVFALGGVDGPTRAREAVLAGAHGVAVIRAVLAADDPGAAAAALVAAVEGARGPR